LPEFCIFFGRRPLRIVQSCNSVSHPAVQRWNDNSFSFEITNALPT
jgi:hypothetical protein